MNFLIDSNDELTSNCIELAKEPGKENEPWFNNDWYTRYATGVNYDGVRTVTWEDVEQKNITAIYILEANKTPEWWCGMDEDGPKENIISALPEKVLNAIRTKRIFLCILADMDYYPFNIDSIHLKSIHDAMIAQKLPAGSVWIGTNDPRYEIAYEQHVKQHGKYFVMEYSNSSDDFVNKPKTAAIEKAMGLSISRDFNSLNKQAVHRPHTSYHLYQTLKSNFLKRGLVSCLNMEDEHAIDMLEYIDEDDIPIFEKVMPQYLPRLVDGDETTNDFEANLPMAVYTGTLMTVVCETSDRRVGFFGRKTMKPLIAGHPFIVFGSKGTLGQLRNLGYRVDLCGIDTSYDSISDHKERAEAAQGELTKWIKRPRQEKLSLIEQSLDDINFNMKKVSLHRRSLDNMTNASRKYFK